MLLALPPAPTPPSYQRHLEFNGLPPLEAFFYGLKRLALTAGKLYSCKPQADCAKARPW